MTVCAKLPLDVLRMVRLASPADYAAGMRQQKAPASSSAGRTCRIACRLCHGACRLPTMRVSKRGENRGIALAELGMFPTGPSSLTIGGGLEGDSPKPPSSQ